jgi:ATP-dependent Lon protease
LTDEPVTVADVLPVLPVRDAVVFPFVILPLSVTDDRSMLAVNRALSEDRQILLLAQRDGEQEDPSAEDLYAVGTAAAILRMLKLPDGRVRILVQGLTRARVRGYGQEQPYFRARLQCLADQAPSRSSLDQEALMRSVKERIEQAANLGRGLSSDVLSLASGLEDAGRLADLVASNLELPIPEAQELLEDLDPQRRLHKVSNLLSREIQVLTVQQEISSEARGEMDRHQREYYLRQQMRAIQQELGETEEVGEEVDTFRRLALEKGLPEKAVEEVERQIRRLRRSHPDSAETATIRTYLEWLTGLPWRTYSPDSLDLTRARRILDRDHYGLDKVKERILEFLAVRKLKAEGKGPLLCFVGPPGVGKTSLGRSIAKALGREFVRLSLGGVRDEAEIRGHRRTYVGALPGRILQSLQQAGTSNPVFMLDEIDKIGADYRGDPSSALLEVLDPEQNNTFRDHYLSVDYDLSKVLFICTANLLDPIQPAFLDRMEVLRLSGYIEEEKAQIARRHLLPKLLKDHGLERRQLRITNGGLRHLIQRYTKEAGVRNLERELAAICRKVAVRVVDGTAADTTTVRAADLHAYLGPEKHFPEELLDQDRVGVATGLAWTAAGGDLLFIEVVAVPGKGKLILTGQLGEVMKESAQAALSFAQSSADLAGIEVDFFRRNDLHVHVPAGSIPKDGPSAGITMATAIVSLASGRPVQRRIAMTGEITLRGDVLPIGGLKEKVLAARSAGIDTILLPKLNARDLEEIPADLRKGITFHLVEHMQGVLDRALGKAEG